MHICLRSLVCVPGRVRMSGEIKILVRSSDSRFGDRLVNCQACWFVIDLRKLLSKILSTKISQESELFHSGKLLSNDMIIGDIFEQNLDDPQLVYLVMPSSQLSSPLPENEEFLGMQRRQYLLDSALEALSSETMGLESNSNQTSLHYMSNNVTYAFMPSDSSENNTAHPMLDDTVGSYLSPLPFGHALNQFMWTYQVYAEYMNQYFQYLENVPQTSTVPAEQNEVENVPFPQNNLRHVGQQPPAQVMNAQGGAFLLDDEEDDRNRDWLDWAYVIMRFVMLMCILYFYSTPVRFITFIIASVIFFIYQAGWLTVPNFRRQHENMQQQDVGDGENRNINEVQRMIPQFVSTLWSIVVCFFVSLAPQVPPPINAN